MATLAQLQTALVNADKAGDMDAARKLSAIVSAERTRLGDLLNIPGYADRAEVAGTAPEKKPEGLLKKVAGVGEAAVSAATGMVAAPVAAAAGIADQVLSGGADDPVATADKVAEAMTYQPRAETGGKILEKVGAVAEPLLALGPMATELGAVGDSVAAVKPVVRAATAEKVVAPILKAVDPIKQAAATLAEQVKQKIAPAAAAPTPGTGMNAGAAALDMRNLRRANAEELGFVGDKALTEGQASRAFEQQRFERETAKLGEVGEPIRRRMQNQNLHMQQTMDEFIDSTGAELSEPRALGEVVDKALSGRRMRDKTRTRALYTEARKSEEAKLPAPADTRATIQGMDGEDIVQSPIDYLNSRPSKVETSKAVDDARANGLHLKVLVKNEDGSYSANPNATVGQMEDWRREVSQSLSRTASDTEIRDVTILKKLIDGVTEPLAGPLYKKARLARATMAKDYENSNLIKQLLGTKPGSTDRAVALEHVFRKSILDPSTSADQISHLERLLKSEGETGQQAWKELQGGMLRHIRDEALKGVTRDSAGNQIVSASGLDRAVNALDKPGKLDLVLGKKRAEQIRTINEVAKDVLTSPPGAVNTSNTATVLAGLMDVAVSGISGVPLPVATVVKQATTRIKDARLRARVKQALGDDHVRH